MGQCDFRQIFISSTLLVILIFPARLFAQSSPQEDSLHHHLTSQKPDTARARTYYQLGLATQKDTRKSLAYCRKSEELIDTANQRPLLAMVYNRMGVHYKNLEVYDSCRIYYWRSLDEYRAQGDSTGVGMVYNNIGEMFRTQGMYQKAIEYLYQSLKRKEETKDTNGIFFTALNLGSAYKSMGDYRRAIEFVTIALNSVEASHDDSKLAKCYNNMGNIYSIEGRYAEAREMHDKSLEANRRLNNAAGIARNYSNIGELFWRQQQYDSAHWYFTEGLHIADSLHMEEGIQILSINMATLAKERGNYAEAEEYALRCYESAQKQDAWDNLRDAALILRECYEHKGDFKKAFFYQGEYYRYRDSISNDENIRKITQEEMKYTFEKKESELKAEQEKAAIIAEEEQARSRLIIYAVSGGLALVLLLLVFIFRSYRIKKKANTELSEKNAIIHQQKEIVEEKNKEILDSINYAKRIQYTLLAHDDLLKENLPAHFVLFKPKDIVSGDFYWATSVSLRAQSGSHTATDSFYLAVCDSTGHGVPGAFMSLLNISFLNEAINEKRIHSPEKIFDHVRMRLVNSISKDGAQDGMDAVLLRFEQSGKITYAAANNSPVIISSGKAIDMSNDKMPVGKTEKPVPFGLNEISAVQGSMLYLFTDGYADQFGGPKGKKFKHRALIELLESIHHLNMEEQRSILEQRFIEWKGTLEQIDDVCVVGIRFG